MVTKPAGFAPDTHWDQGWALLTIDIADNYPQNASIALLNTSEDLGIALLNTSEDLGIALLNTSEDLGIVMLNTSEDLGIVMLFSWHGQRFAGALDEKMRFLLIRAR